MLMRKRVDLFLLSVELATAYLAKQNCLEDVFPSGLGGGDAGESNLARGIFELLLMCLVRLDKWIVAVKQRIYV